MSENGNGKPPFELKWLDPNDLEDNPRNWRVHGPTQTLALEQAIAAAGWAGVACLNTRTNRLLDGHLRKKVAIKRGELIPTIVGEWSEEQERLILSTLDPISSLASANTEALDALLAEVRNDVAGGLLSFEAPVLEDLLVGYSERASVSDPLAPSDFAEYDENVETEYCCPRCQYEWSGKPK